MMYTTVSRDILHLNPIRTKMQWKAQVQSVQEDKYLWVSFLRNRHPTAPKLAASLNKTRDTPVCTYTVCRRRLGSAGLMGRVARKNKKELRFSNWKKRLQTKMHKQWILDDRSQVLWTDESKFAVFGSKWRTCVRHRDQENMINACLTP